MRYLIFLILSLGLYAQTITVETGSYTGNATNPRTITTTVNPAEAGKAVFVMVKSNSTNYCMWRTDDMPADSSASFYDAGAWIADAITSFSSTGFVVNSYLNANAILHYYMVVVADTSLMTTRKYTGTGANRTFTLPFAPGLFIYRNAATGPARWKIYTLGADSIISVRGLYNTVEFQNPGFSGTAAKVTGNGGINGSGRQYYFVAIKNDANFLSAIKYTGNGASRTLTYDRAISQATPISIFCSQGTTVNYPSGWRTDKMTTNQIARIVNNTFYTGFDGQTVSQVTADNSVITNASAKKYEAWVLTSYSTPAAASTDIATKPGCRNFKWNGGWKTYINR